MSDHSRRTFFGCPECRAEIMYRCKPGCSNSRNRGENAPRCYDGLHHHCALLPWCAGPCVNDQRDPIFVPCPVCDGSAEECVGVHDFGKWAVDPPEPIFDRCRECDATGTVETEGEPITLEDLDVAHG